MLAAPRSALNVARVALNSASLMSENSVTPNSAIGLAAPSLAASARLVLKLERARCSAYGMTMRGVGVVYVCVCVCVCVFVCRDGGEVAQPYL